MVKSTIVTGKALLTWTSSAMQGTCNSLIVLGSFSDGLLASGKSLFWRSRLFRGSRKRRLQASLSCNKTLARG